MVRCIVVSFVVIVSAAIFYGVGAGVCSVGHQMAILGKINDEMQGVESLVAARAELKKQETNAGICDALATCYVADDVIRHEVDQIVDLRAKLWANFDPAATNRIDEFVCQSRHIGSFDQVASCLAAYPDEDSR